MRMKSAVALFLVSTQKDEQRSKLAQFLKMFIYDKEYSKQQISYLMKESKS